MNELELLRNIRGALNSTYVIWHDGENYQLSGNKQELYGYLYRLRKMLNAREKMKAEWTNSDSLTTEKQNAQNN